MTYMQIQQKYSERSILNDQRQIPIRYGNSWLQSKPLENHIVKIFENLSGKFSLRNKLSKLRQ